MTIVNLNNPYLTQRVSWIPQARQSLINALASSQINPQLTPGLQTHLSGILEKFRLAASTLQKQISEHINNQEQSGNLSQEEAADTRNISQHVFAPAPTPANRYKSDLVTDALLQLDGDANLNSEVNISAALIAAAQARAYESTQTQNIEHGNLAANNFNTMLNNAKPHLATAAICAEVAQLRLRPTPTGTASSAKLLENEFKHTNLSNILDKRKTELLKAGSKWKAVIRDVSELVEGSSKSPFELPTLKPAGA